MIARCFHGLQAAIIAAVRPLDDRGQFSLDELLEEVRKHNPALLHDMSEHEQLAAAYMTIDRETIADGALGWLQLDHVGDMFRSREHSCEEERSERSDQEVSQHMLDLANAHREIFDATISTFDAFMDWLHYYREKQLADIVVMEGHLKLLEDTGCDTLGEAIDKAADDAIDRARGGT